MGRIEVGDTLFDDRGEHCQVVFTSQIMLDRPCYDIRLSDGTVITADDDHGWIVLRDGAEEFMTTRVMAEGLSAGARLEFKNCKPLRGGVALRSRTERRRRLRSMERELTCGEVFANEDHAQFRGAESTFLARSLGYTVPFDSLLVRLGGRERRREVRAVRRRPSVPVRCIQVDSPSRLFLCGRTLVPTHNTFLMAEEIRRAARLAVLHRIGVENEIWYGAPNFLQAKRVMWGRLKRTIPARWIDGKPNETSCHLRLRSGHVIRIVGLDAYENLRGSGLWFFGGDEWADCKHQAWSEVVRPMLSTAGGHALLVGTPKGFDHFRDMYMLGQGGDEPGFTSFLYTTAAGGNVSVEEIDAARRHLDARTFRQEYEASFESYAGRVLYAFSRFDNVKTAEFDARLPVHVGLDFNINPMSATVWQEVGLITCQIDEIVLPTSNTDEMAAEIARRYGRPGFDGVVPDLSKIFVYPDPAGAQRRTSAGGRTDIGILRQKGFNVVELRSHPAVRDRINVMNRAFRTADGLVSAVVSQRCVKSIEAYERLSYRDGTNEPDKSGGFDHLVDATGYYLYTRFSSQPPMQNNINIMER